MKTADREIIDQLNRIYDAQAAGGDASFASLTGSPEDNAALDAALDAKQGDLGFTPVPDTRTVNGHALSGNVTVSKSDVGLGNADNTADTAKPVSTDQATAIAGKVSDTAYDATSWDGVTTIAPSKNAVRDKIEAVVASIPTVPVLASGTYTPTSSGAVNLDSDPNMTACQYMRVGSVVTVSGEFVADPTLTGLASFRIDLPVASAISNSFEAGGCFDGNAGLASPGHIKGNNSDVKFEWIAAGAGSTTFSFIFTYQIIP